MLNPLSIIMTLFTSWNNKFKKKTLKTQVVGAETKNEHMGKSLQRITVRTSAKYGPEYKMEVPTSH